jgi:hypothetical protein
LPKYRNRKTVIDNITFDSRKEAIRYTELKVLEAAGTISNLQRQTKFLLLPKQGNERPVHYLADFTYQIDNKLICEDVKSPYTRKLPLYILKRKLMKYFHQIEIQEV